MKAEKYRRSSTDRVGLPQTATNQTAIRMSRLFGFVFLAGLLLWTVGQFVAQAADEAKSKPSKTRTPESAKVQDALTEFNSLIGEWRGVGMPKRNSTSGAWKESANWIWDFDTTPVSIRYDVDDGKLLESARLSYDLKNKMYTLVTTVGEDERSYTGKLDGNKLILETDPSEEREGHRLTITQLNEKRTLVLHEKRRAGQKFFSRVAEIGYTREGTRLAEPGAGEPECVVTGGYGSMKVMFEGETYYVCCSGCLQAFQADPAGVIAEYKKKVTERKKENSSDKSAN